MDSSQTEFANWLSTIWEWFQKTIEENPAMYKCSRMRPSFASFIISPSTNAELYPDRLSCRLDTRRPQGGAESLSVAVIESNGKRINPSEVWSGSFLTPVFKMSYYLLDGEFGLNLTVLKGEYENMIPPLIQNDAWIMDSNTSGSGSGEDSVEESLMV